MKTLIENIQFYLQQVVLKKEEKERFLLVICARNTLNLKLISLFTIATSTLQTITFYIRSQGITGTEWIWRQYIIFSHLIIIGFYLLILIYLYFVRNSQKFSVCWKRPLFHISFLFILISGAAIASFDQLSIQAITPFLMVTIVASLLIVIPPYFAFTWFLTAFIFFSFLLPVYQPDTEIVLSHQINAISIMVVGFLLNIIRWNGILKHLRQSASMDEQQQRLEQQNKELQQKTRELKEANKVRDKLFTTIAHDLRNPFQVLLSSSEILLDETTALTGEEEKTLMHFIRKTSQNTLLQLQNLLEWGQIQRNKVHLSLRLTHMTELIESNIREFEMPIRDKKLIVNKYLSDAEIHVDPVLIGSVIRNLVSNAVKFTPQNGKISVKSHSNSQYFVIQVSDNGIGMSSELVRNLFISDSDTGRAGTNGEISTGIGLQLCKEFVEIHGGRISVESKENLGTTFTIELPIKNAAPGSNQNMNS